MRNSFVPCVIGCALAATLLGQVSSAAQVPEPKPSQATPPKRGDVVTIEGCINRDVLTDRKTMLTYRLKGAKELMRRVDKEHQGHIDQVTGTVKSERKFANERRRTEKKTTFVVGVREVSKVPKDEAELEELEPLLEVASIQHLGGGCPPGGRI